MDASLEGLTLHVADVDRSRDFYLRIPGVEVLFQRPGEFALLRIGNGRLGLISAAVLPPGSPRFHVEISTSSAGVDELYEQVRSAGITPEDSPTDRAWGERTFHVTDPDGNMVEFDSRRDEE